MSFDPNLLPYFDPNVERRVCFITGGNSGIGFYTVLHLYLHGYIVYLAGRNRQKVETAITEIKAEAERRRETYTARQLARRHIGRIHLITCDLLELDSVEEAAKQFRIQEKSLHLLILNAGIMAVPHAQTADGFEVQVQTSYLAHFLLTDRLVDLMENVNDPRIIFLSSIGHWFASFHFNLDMQFNYWPDLFFSIIRYGMAKCAGIHFIKIMAKRHPKILSVAVHPGIIITTNLFTHLTNIPILGTLFWLCFTILQWFFGVSNENGSLSTVKCSLSDNLDATKDNGKFYVTFGQEAEPSFVAKNEQYQNETWAWTVEHLGSVRHHINSL
ncbi:Env9 protein [Martiniozyma asiatica (nom. inval.)]|nr:Env9 protein [Martiniozyma asiatica]